MAGMNVLRASVAVGALLLGSPAFAQEAPSGDGSTPLHWAAHRDDLAGVDRLVRGGANVNAANDLGATPLWAASVNGSTAVVKRLLDAGAKPDAAGTTAPRPQRRLQMSSASMSAAPFSRSSAPISALLEEANGTRSTVIRPALL